MDQINPPTVPVKDSPRKSLILRGPGKQYVPGVREPYRLPDREIELPAPERITGSPPKFNWLTLLPPILMMAMAFFLRGASSNPLMFAMYGIGAISPIIGGVSAIVQKRNYKKALEKREQDYRHILDQDKRELAHIVQRQRNILNGEYPAGKALMNIAFAKGGKERLWWRRPDNSDFLAARIGISKGEPSFSIKMPQSVDRSDPLLDLAAAILQEYSIVTDLPFLADLKKVGSLGICGRDTESVYGAVYRLLLDLIIHQSPGDLQLAVLSDTGDGPKYWEWLKWAPHTQALKPGSRERKLAFNSESIKEFLLWLVEEVAKRQRQEPGRMQIGPDDPALVIVVDDRGKLRQSRDIVYLLRRCTELGIYFVFVRDHNLPNIGARIEVSNQGAFRYAETWEGGSSQRGKAEFMSLPECEAVTRSLSQIDLLGIAANVSLPNSVRLSNILETSIITESLIRSNWEVIQTPGELLQFPIGVYVGREGLDQTVINLLPSRFGGEDAYHSLLIGTTGSGKSEFMKSLVLGAAIKYSPEHLNFFFLDFKGGAAFEVLRKLPHVVGIVTNLRPELVLRGLDAIQSEIERRQQQFAASGVSNIWEYNNRNTRQMPNLLLLLDEFAAGLDQFPALAEILDLLVRQGRSLGMYLFLANQDVNSTVDKLLTNIGWRIALKVARPEEMSIIDKLLPVAKRAGQGYLRSLSGDIYEFQGAYAGFPVISPTTSTADEFTISRIEADGVHVEIYNHSKRDPQLDLRDAPTVSEENVAIGLMEQIAINKGYQNSPIYLDPLPEEIVLADVLDDSVLYRRFSQHGWDDNVHGSRRLLAPVGYYDLPQKCLQQTLAINFNDQDGHLWIVGSPGSGVAMSLKTVITSLAVTHSPADVAIYILEFGSGDLLPLKDLPHVGAVIRSTEQERIERLFKLIDREIDYRTSGIGADQNLLEVSHISPSADIFLVINNFNELKAINFDWVDSYVTRYVQSGKSAKVHVIITSSRGTDLHRKVSGNIARRLVLEMATRDEYYDITGQKVLPLGLSAKGRGYWVDREIGIAECQIASPELIPTKGDDTISINFDIIAAMRKAWRGNLHLPIGTIPTRISLKDIYSKQLPQANTNTLKLPIGVSYESLEIVTPDFMKELPHWLVLGPKRSGKTNFLACLANSLLHINADWEIKIFTLKPRNPLTELYAQVNDVQLFDIKSTLPEIQNITEQLTLSGDSTSKQFLLVDDVGALFSRGNENIKAAFTDLALRLGSSSNIYLVAAGLPDELRMGPALADEFIKLLKQSNTGLVFSKDTMILDWYGVTAQAINQYRKLDFDPGRGFFISTSKAQLIQTPYVDGFDDAG